MIAEADLIFFSQTFKCYTDSVDTDDFLWNSVLTNETVSIFALTFQACYGKSVYDQAMPMLWSE
jgi:hypothetical protein